jgi:hypothetical protein
MHIVIALTDDNERLLGIVETFLKAQAIRHRYRAKSRTSNFSEGDGSVNVTLLLADSIFVIKPPDVIICLDGGATATEIRRKKWANNPERPVPILELVIPRSVSHIDLCLSSQLSASLRLHTIILSLAQLYNNGDTGKPIVETPSPEEAAKHVAKYLVDLEEPGAEVPEWPLPNIHSIKGVVELVERSSQITQEKFPREGTPPAPSTKRPLVSICHPFRRRF